MDSIQSTPSNPVVQALIDALRWGKGKLTDLPILGEKGSWLHENAPEMLMPEGGLGVLQNAAEGHMPWRVPEGSRIPQIRQDVGHTRGVRDLVDAAGMLPVAAALKAAKPVATTAALYKVLPTRKVEHGVVGAFKPPGGNIILPDVTQTLEESPVDIWKTKQLTNYLRRKFGTGDDPVAMLHESSPEFRDALSSLNSGLYSDYAMHAFKELANRDPALPAHAIARKRMAEAKKLTKEHSQFTSREFNAWDRFARDNSWQVPRGHYEDMDPFLSHDQLSLPPDALIHEFSGSNLNKLLSDTTEHLSNALKASSPDAEGAAAALRKSGLQLSEKDLSQMAVVDALRHYGRGQKALTHYRNPAAPINAAVVPVGKSFEDGSRWVKYDKEDMDLAYKGLKTEGREMSHCIGDNREAYLNKEGDVYSLRDKSGKPVVTAAVSSPTGEIIEARGKANRALKLEEVDKLKQLVKDASLNEGSSYEAFLE